jgi:hypothetical protein
MIDEQITERDLREVQAAVDEAEAEIAKLRERGGWRSLMSGTALAGARARRDAAAEELERLTALYEAEQATIADRPKIEKSYASEITAAGKALDAGAKRVTAAVNAAQAVMVELADACSAHNANVRKYGPELAAAGLGLPEQGEVKTGGGRGGVRIRGRWYTPVDAGAAIAWVAFRVARARLPRVHGLARVLQFIEGRGRLDRHDLFAKVDAVPVVHHETPMRPAAPKIESPVSLTATQRAEIERRGPAVVFDDPSGGWPKWATEA